MIHLLVDEKSVIDVFSVRKALGLLKSKKSKIFFRESMMEEMADEEMVDSILGKEFEEHMLYIIHLIGTNPDMIIN